MTNVSRYGLVSYLLSLNPAQGPKEIAQLNARIGFLLRQSNSINNFIAFLAKSFRTKAQDVFPEQYRRGLLPLAATANKIATSPNLEARDLAQLAPAHARAYELSLPQALTVMRTYCDILPKIAATMGSRHQRVYLLHDTAPFAFIDHAKTSDRAVKTLALQRNHLGPEIETMVDIVKEAKDVLRRTRDLRGPKAQVLAHRDGGQALIKSLGNELFWDQLRQELQMRMDRREARDPLFSKMIQTHRKYLDSYFPKDRQTLLVDTGKNGSLPAYIVGLFPQRPIRLLLIAGDLFPHVRGENACTPLEAYGYFRVADSNNVGSPTKESFPALDFLPPQSLKSESEIVAFAQLMKHIYETIIS